MPDQPIGPAYPFIGHYPDQTMVWSAADDVLRQAGNVDTLRTDVDAGHRPARVGVSGLLADAMDNAPAPVMDRTASWLGSVLVAGGAIRLFGDAIQGYNNGINDLNRLYWQQKAVHFGVAVPSDANGGTHNDDFQSKVSAADSALLVQLRSAQARLEQGLDDVAAVVAGLLDSGPDDASTVLTLYQAGTLPLGATAAFPRIDFRSIDRVALYENLARTGRIGDDVDMTSFVEGVDPGSAMDGGRSGGILTLLRQRGQVLPPGWQAGLVGEDDTNWARDCVKRVHDPACIMNPNFEPQVIATSTGPGHLGRAYPIGAAFIPGEDPTVAAVFKRDYHYDVEQLRYLGAQQMDNGTTKLFFDSVTREYVQSQEAVVSNFGPDTGFMGISDDFNRMEFSGLDAPKVNDRHVHQNWVRVIDVHPDGTVSEE